MVSIRRDLLKAARGRTTITYGELMRLHGVSRGRPLTSAIGEVDRLEAARGGPGFAALVVRKDTGFPGGGYFCDDELPLHLRRPDQKRTDPRLSAAERDHVLKQQKRIWDFYGSTR